MQRCTVHVKSLHGSAYSQSRKHDTEFKERESHEDYDKRTWLEKCTVNRDGHVCIPNMAQKQAIDTAAQKLGTKVPNRRGATFKNYFSSGVQVMEDAVISVGGKPLTKDDAEKIIIQANSNGVRGSGKRVPRAFPVFPKWEATFVFLISDDIINESVFKETITAAGIIVGVGRFRAEKGGTNGRFTIEKITWEDFRL